MWWRAGCAVFVSHPATTILTGCHPVSARGSEVQMAPSVSELLLGVITVVASLRPSVERGERHSAHQVADFVDGEATNRWRVSVRRLQPALNSIEEPCSARRGTLHRSDPWSPELRADRRRLRHALALIIHENCVGRFFCVLGAGFGGVWWRGRCGRGCWGACGDGWRGGCGCGGVRGLARRVGKALVGGAGGCLSGGVRWRAVLWRLGAGRGAAAGRAVRCGTPRRAGATVAGGAVWVLRVAAAR